MVHFVKLNALQLSGVHSQLTTSTTLVGPDLSRENIPVKRKSYENRRKPTLARIPVVAMVFAIHLPYNFSSTLDAVHHRKKERKTAAL